MFCFCDMSMISKFLEVGQFGIAICVPPILLIEYVMKYAFQDKYAVPLASLTAMWMRQHGKSISVIIRNTLQQYPPSSLT